MVNPPYTIIPSILSANFLRLEEEVQSIVDAGLNMLHIDIMDNHYVPNLTFGPWICRTLKQRFPSVRLDVHIMATPVDELIIQLTDIGVDRISIHPAATIHLDRSLQLIRDHHCQAGIVLNPAVGIDVIEWSLYHLDFALIMTVNPGFEGQALIPSVIQKVNQLHQRFPQLPLCIDGGVNPNTIAQLAKAGATEFVAGSAIFHSDNYAKTISTLQQRANG